MTICPESYDGTTLTERRYDVPRQIQTAMGRRARTIRMKNLLIDLTPIALIIVLTLMLRFVH
jgi:hypothetical protein